MIVAQDNLVKENGYLVDYSMKYYARLKQNPEVEKYGWRVFFEDGSFAGLLDESKVAVWNTEDVFCTKKMTVGSMINHLMNYPENMEVRVVVRTPTDDNWDAPVSMIENELYGLDAENQVGIVVEVER